MGEEDWWWVSEGLQKGTGMIGSPAIIRTAPGALNVLKILCSLTRLLKQEGVHNENGDWNKMLMFPIFGNGDFFETTTTHLCDKCMSLLARWEGRPSCELKATSSPCS